LFFLIIALIPLSIVLSIYSLYYVLIYGAKNKVDKYLGDLQRTLEAKTASVPNVSVIIPTYEEAKVIRRKLANMASLEYPLDRMEILVVDDASKDETAEIAESAFLEHGLNGRVLKNRQRIGLNASLNVAIEAASNDIVCLTDSDVAFEKSALRNVISVLEGMNKVGGVTGNISPSFNESNRVTQLEEGYRNFSNRSMLVESFRHSAFPGSGVLTVFRRSVLTSLIPTDYGSTDGNLSISIIKGGYRFVYVPYADVYEPVPESLSQHRLQKVRRAKRLIQVLIHNTDILFNKKYGEFGSVIFPLKFAMFVICPTLIVIGSASLIIFVILSQSIVLWALLMMSLVSVALSFMISRRLASFLSGFVLHQVYLLLGLFSSFKKGVFWKKIDRR